MKILTVYMNLFGFLYIFSFLHSLMTYGEWIVMDLVFASLLLVGRRVLHRSHLTKSAGTRFQ
ncbi:hypothetical protein N781_03890 [Pontibacillus halophilus JSM 076056 = DSM 19796]|uniref:Uncharacterized protein n=1 Tax=Pontibacillus halophilus JSM 076056 = DSM 19796 TaxID=1385510 RepID=A0A0A5GKJ9_9BACI|nr:hypothetical protein [Pontibacillus halophilus]KGX91690.1 hypothetical protein N781_03890 [Pontibacillus halophilus JSM 076056 = DSM 19796]